MTSEQAEATGEAVAARGPGGGRRRREGAARRPGARTVASANRRVWSPWTRLAAPFAVVVASLGGAAAVGGEAGSAKAGSRVHDVVAGPPSTSAPPPPTSTPARDPFALCGEVDLAAFRRSHHQWWRVERLDRDGNGVLCD